MEPVFKQNVHAYDVETHVQNVFAGGAVVTCPGEGFESRLKVTWIEFLKSEHASRTFIHNSANNIFDVLTGSNHTAF